jgi:hypothetical protein
MPVENTQEKRRRKREAEKRKVSIKLQFKDPTTEESHNIFSIFTLLTCIIFLLKVSRDSQYVIYIYNTYFSIFLGG